ncbi:MAG: 2-phospho-L-lactate transferase, partial [Chloroflexi bacterium]|nr:2-phospho-L-lactate transferase [Chloroflexota bacterium]
EAIQQADAIVIAPSNPFVSIGPILGVRSLRKTLARRRRDTVAISPIIGGAAVKGPADRMLRGMGMESSAVGVAMLYTDVARAFIVDDVDGALARRIGRLGMDVVVAPTLMRGLPEKEALAGQALRAALGEDRE